LILYTDGMCIDKHGRLRQEPVMFTLGIFKNELRRRPEVWRHIGFIVNDDKLMKSREEMNEVQDQVLKDDVPGSHNDYHAQLRVILNDVKKIQELENGLQWRFTIDGEMNSKIYQLFFPIQFIIGDTVGHNKLCSLKGGPTSITPCRFCNIKRCHLDNLDVKAKLHDSTLLHQLILNDKEEMKRRGFHPCVHNILYELTYCHPKGLSMSLPPENLHAILLGLYVRLLQGFARSKHERIDNQYVFTGSLLPQIEMDLKILGKQLSQQSDPDLPRTHFPSGYIPDPRKSEDGTTGKKAGHELRGVILTIYVYLLQESAAPATKKEKNQQLMERMGNNRVAAFGKLYEMSMLFEAWMNMEKYSEFEVLLVKKFLPFYVTSLVDTVNRSDGQGMKLIKVHLLAHIPSMIKLFGSPTNVDSSRPESNLKTRVKNPSNKTRKQAHDFEKRTADKDHEGMILHAGASEVVRKGDSNILLKYIADMQFIAAEEDRDRVRKRNGAKFILKFDNEEGNIIQHINAHNAMNKGRKWEGLITFLQLKEFLTDLGGVEGDLHTQYNSESGIKYRGNPVEGRHDWAVVQYGPGKIICQFLCFLNVKRRDGIVGKTTLDSIDEDGTYAIVHYVDQNVFAERPTKRLYGKIYNTFCIDKNCMLLTGWSKHTHCINGHTIPQEVPKATLAIVKVNKILMPCTGIVDKFSSVPHSYLFLPPKNLWSKLFIKRIKQLIPDVYEEIKKKIEDQ
jgi:hypothetical protein